MGRSKTGRSREGSRVFFSCSPACTQKLYNTALLWQMILRDSVKWLVYGVKILISRSSDYYFCTLFGVFWA